MNDATDKAAGRRVRSFVKRPGRLTTGQKRALSDLWPTYGVDATATINFDALFERSDGARVLEIGYGDGESLVAMANANPQLRILGCEIHEPGIGHCLLGLESIGASNVRLIATDAVELMTERLAPASLERINLYFPDPWPKKRHHKRRLVDANFLTLAARVLVGTGTLHIATDWAPYAEHVDAQLATATPFQIRERVEHQGERPLDRVTTKFERRGLALGHTVVDWIVERRS